LNGAINICWVSPPQMPTELTLCYSAYCTIKVPNKVARKLKAAQEHEEFAQSFDPKKPWTFGNKWGNIFYTDDDGVEHEIEGEAQDCDMKRTEDCEWGEEEESDEDDEEDDEEEDEDHEVVMTAEDEEWEEIYNSTGGMPGEPREHEWESGTYYQTYGGGGGPGGAGGYWVRTGGNAVLKVEGNDFRLIGGAILEVKSPDEEYVFGSCRLRLLIK